MFSVQLLASEAQRPLENDFKFLLCDHPLPFYVWCSAMSVISPFVSFSGSDVKMLSGLSFLVFFIATIASPIARNAKIIGRDTDLQFSYDFVIVGGGTSGLTVADRLTEDPESA